MRSNEDILRRINHTPSDGRPPIRYRIQFLDQSSVDDVVSLMFKYFVPRENIYNSFGGTMSEEELKEFEQLWREKLSLGMSLAAFLEDDQGNRGELISSLLLSIAEKNKPETPEKQTKVTAWRQKKMKMMEYLWAKADVFTLYNCSSVIIDYGLTVKPEYGGRGIGTEMLNAIDELSRRVNVPVTAIEFTGAASQKAGARSGFQILVELDLTTFRVNGELGCANPKWPLIKWTAKRHF